MGILRRALAFGFVVATAASGARAGDFDFELDLRAVN